MSKTDNALSENPESSEISQPYDTWFRRSMQEKKIAIDLLRSKLPETLLAQMDLSTLTLVNGTSILKGLNVVHSDCVYRCSIRGSDGYIIIASEHQSRAEKMMAFRVLEYAVGIMINHLAQGHKKLPIVIPLVLYHGIQSPYPYSTEIWYCFEQPELAKQWALKPFQLIDLTVMSDEEINHHGLASMMELLLKHAREEQVLSWVKKMLKESNLAIIYSEMGPGYVQEGWRYIVKACGSDKHPEERDQVVVALANAFPEIGEEIMTFAQQFKQEGLQQGLEKGRLDERFAIAKNLLGMGIDLNSIKEATHLSEEEISRLRLH
jgi:predicted transposase/invertase (TIGR01784 family)